MAKKSSLDNVFKEKQLMILALIGVVITFIVFGPVVNKLKSRLASQTKLNKEYERLATKYEVLEGIDKVLVSERVKKMEEVFPSKKPIVQLMGSLNQLASEYNLSFGGITLRPGTLSQEEADPKMAKERLMSKLPAELKDLKFGFQIAGSFEAISEFMDGLENLAPLMKIDQLSLAIKSSPYLEGQSLSVIADIEVEAYYQIPPKSLGSVGKPVELLSREDEAVMNRLFSFKTFEVVIPVAPTGKVDLFSTGLEAPL